MAGATRAAFPKNFKPQLATLASRVPDGDDWLHELKFDGYRIVAYIRNGRATLITRNNNDWTARFKVVAEAVGELPVESAILDGEVVSLNENGVSNFQQLQNSLKSGDKDTLVYYLFDIAYLNGYDLTQLPLLERKEVLARVVLSWNPDNEGTVRYSDHIPGRGAQVLQQACRSGMEGIICKRADSAYQQYRSASWLKVKCLKQQEFVIGGFTKPEGSRTGFGALLIGYHEAGDNGDLVYAGRVGTGFSTQSLRQLATELKKRRTDAPPFTNPPTGSMRRDITWVRPELVGEVEFTEWTSDGRLRHPSFQGLREDKPASDVVRELEKSPGELKGASMNGSSRKPRRGRASTAKLATKEKSRARSQRVVRSFKRSIDCK